MTKAQKVKQQAALMKTSTRVQIELYDSHGYASDVPYLTLWYTAEDPQVQAMIAFAQAMRQRIELIAIEHVDRADSIESGGDHA